jgi:hypothetical protein
MYEKSLNEAESFLSVQKDPIIPVRKVWEELKRSAKIKGFDVASLADFSAMLDGDRRFQIITASMTSNSENENIEEGLLEDDDMENLGFCSEDRVKLRNRRVSEATVKEDDEEVGSIKRCAFMSAQSKGPSIDIKNRNNLKTKKKSKTVKGKPAARKKTVSRPKKSRKKK